MNENLAQKQDSIDSEFIKKLRVISSSEEKIKFSLDEMKVAISNDQKPDFKTFWEIKNICLTLFKEPISASSRVEYWKEYIVLSNEIKSLKYMLNEQTSFEVEQIDLAIQAIEEEMEKYDVVMQAIKDIEIDNKIRMFFTNQDFYFKTQKELNLLNSFAARVNSLRKEIIKIHMRISLKNKLLKRLTIIGDVVFPKRKQFIDQISDEFTKLIDCFMSKTFDLHRQPFFVLKEQIKSFQNIAKKFTLNTESFTNCRLKLSECWDKVKIAEKSYKKEKQKSKESVNQIMKKIHNLKSICEKDPNVSVIEKEESEIFNLIKSLELRKEDIKFLKHKIREAKGPIFKKEEIKKIDKLKTVNNKEDIKKTKLEKIKQTLTSLLENKDLNFEELCQEKIQIEKEIEAINLLKFEKLMLEKQLRELNHIIEDKKENVNLNTSDELKNMLAIFENKKKRRLNVKSHVDNLNKELSGSGLDFEKAMLYRDLIDSEKQRLEKIDSEISELEEKIADLESN
ncbi:MAG: hypothetical protein K940chlam1_00009 [Candidatus Anoxychlamydiales bacterium]|nr:hypothetical protein [Candidatus Anoxychlamydiales bacterium]